MHNQALPFLNDEGAMLVYEGHFFVMGDHRNDSNDSRQNGSLPRENIIGKVECVLFPFDRIRGID